jgi:hypothetical protein
MDKYLKNNLTIEDIHRIREEDYDRQKNMSFEEMVQDVEKEAQKMRDYISELRRKRNYSN